MNRILQIKGLNVSFSAPNGEVQAVRGLDMYVNKGEAVALVGESGSGKSVTAQAIMRLIPNLNLSGKVTAGSIIFNNRDLVQCTNRDMECIRGREMGMIFQDPMTSLNPTMRVGRQIDEILEKHQRISGAHAKKRCVELLDLVGIPFPEKRMFQYPHELSGGMRQRVMIAMAVACNPLLIIADEPTTALDVTVQAQIIELLKNLQEKLGTSILLITHDFGIVARLCHRVAVMYAGQLVEYGLTEDIFYNPAHPYTKGLLESVSRPDAGKEHTLKGIPGQPPSLTSLPEGCAFRPRCGQIMKICETEEPPEVLITEHHGVRCWLNVKQKEEDAR